MIYILIIFIFLIYLVRKSNTEDLIKQANLTTDQQKNDLEEKTIKYKTTKFSCLLFTIALISLVTIASIRLTSIETKFLDYFGTGINHKEMIIPIIWYITPFFILVIRGILIEVHVGDYVLKTYNLKEEEIDTKEALNTVKGLFYKKAPTSTPTPVSNEEQNLVDEHSPTTPEIISAPTQESAPIPQPVIEQPTPVKESSIPTPVAPVAQVTEEIEQLNEQEQNNVNPFDV